MTSIKKVVTGRRLANAIGFIAELLLESSRLDSVSILWARKRGVDGRDSSTDGYPTRFDASGERVGVGRCAG
jgi:hypothetical protein